MSHESYSCPYCSTTITPAAEAVWGVRVEEIRAHLLLAHGYLHLPPSRTGESWYRSEDYAEAQPKEILVVAAPGAEKARRKRPARARQKPSVR